MGIKEIIAKPFEVVGEPWEYTDDIIAGVIVVGYIFGGQIGVVVPEWALQLTLTWVFGTDIAERLRK